MNILPKKRWHVRTKDNIARVRKDEAAAREELSKKEEKLKLAESEARVNCLRTRSGQLEKQQHETAEENSVNEYACISQHVNLFADYKTHLKTTNKDLEKEKKEEQEKYEKKIGYLTYLGQDTNEALRLKSWYEVAPKRLDEGSERGEIREKDLKIKHNNDPLTLINALLPPDPKPIAQSTSLKCKTSAINKLMKEKEIHHKTPKRHKKVRKNRKKEKRSKEHRHKKEKRKEKNIIEKEIEKRLKLEELRKKRLHRENVERERQEALLIPKEFKKPTKIISSLPKIVQKYNNQFNPELAKQNIN